MKTRIQKWGNSLAVRIPKTFAAEAGLREDSEIEISLSGGHILIEAVEEKNYTLEDLLSQVTEDNIHGEIDFDGPVGKEVW